MSNKVKCKICKKIFSVKGFHHHLRGKHDISPNKYIEKYGEYRPNKIKKYKNDKKGKIINCEICHNDYSILGFATHLKNKHNITKEKYIEKYGEYRPDEIEKKKRKSNNNYICKICNKKLMSERQLSFHVRKKHDISKKEYVKKYIFNENIPKCKCGCGKEVKILNQKPYYRKYISGHNSKCNNGMTGKSHSEKAKEQMSKKAKQRVKNYREKSGSLGPWHSEEANKKRKKSNRKRGWKVYKQTLNKNDVKLINMNKINKTKTPVNEIDIFKFKCKNCGHKWTHMNKYPICPKCNYTKNSHLEENIFNYINKITSKKHVIRNDRRKIYPSELDIFIPSKNKAIEVNGLYWHSTKNKEDKYYHLKKTKRCNKNNIDLIHIFEDEWKNKKQIVKDKLIHILNIKDNDKNKVYGRKIDNVKEIDSKTKNNFLEKYHIQGKDRSKYKFGAYYDNKLVAIMTFRKPQKSMNLNESNSNKETYELSRYSTNSDYICVGTFGKLFKHFIRNYNIHEVYTYADRRWTLNKDNNLYTKNNFKFVKETEPNYWYFKNGIRYHRYKFAKHKLVENGYNENKTEKEIMKERNFGIIYDCGHFKYKYKV